VIFPEQSKEHVNRSDKNYLSRVKMAERIAWWTNRAANFWLHLMLLTRSSQLNAQFVESQIQLVLPAQGITSVVCVLHPS